MAVPSEFPRVVLFPVTVELHQCEWVVAHVLGQMRRKTNRGNRIVDRQVGNAHPERTDILGAVAEIAFARISGLAPDLDTRSRRASVDAVLPSGRSVDVKATEHATGRLIMPVSKDRLDSDELADLVVHARVFGMDGDSTTKPSPHAPPPRVEFVGYAETSELLQPHRVQGTGQGWHKPTYVLDDGELCTVLGILYASDDDRPGADEPEYLDDTAALESLLG